MAPPVKKKRPSKRPGDDSRAGLYIGIVILLLLASYFWALDLARPNVEGDPLRLDEFATLVQGGRIQDARLLDVDGFVVGRYVAEDGTTRMYSAEHLKSPGGVGYFTNLLLENSIPTTVDQQNSKRIAQLATTLLPGIILVMVFVYLILTYRKGTGLFSTRSGARKIEAEETGVSFKDVAGHEEAIGELREIVDFLKSPERFHELGARIPKGILLYGPPGCGKTLLAKALASEASASFYSISGSDFIEIWVGLGAARVRDLFKEARNNTPAIVFIDELDSIGRSRMSGPGSEGELEQSLNQILAEMDGFSPYEGLIVLGATNRPDVLDPALLRPGRFDRAIGLDRPGESMRLEVLKVHGRGKKLDSTVDLEKIASRALGLSGADLANVMNEGALLAARRGKTEISHDDLEGALIRILQEPERQRRLSLRERGIGRKSVYQEERITFADVAGVDEAIEELRDITDYLGNPDHFSRMGARVPRGILLVGPPGCGKTLLARAVAGESNASFISLAATEFVEVFVGTGASRVRNLFAEAQALAPAILFIDEIDAIGGKRSATSAGGTKEVENTLNQLLVELDGFGSRSGVIVMAATNRPDMLDPAVTRPGRFDRHVTIEPPDRDGRRAILNLHAKGKPLADDVDLDAIAGLTRGYSGADLFNLLNEAALLAARRRQPLIDTKSLDEALDRAMLGISSRGHIMTDEERKIVAYHEAGHALVARALPGTSPPNKLTIAGRGRALGFVRHFEESDKIVRTRDSLIDELAGLLGGRASEILIFGDPSAGAADDLMRVGDLAYRMVTQLGMGEKLGPMTISSGSNGYGRFHSEELARTIDAEVQKIVGEAEARARFVLESSRKGLDKVAAALMERETLTSEEIDEVAGPVVTNALASKRRARAK